MKRFCPTFILCVIILILSSVSYAALPLQFEISGIPETIKENIINRVQLHKEYQEQNDNTYEITEPEIKEHALKAMQPFGYFSPDIQISTSKTEKQHIIKLKINLGSALKIKKLDIKLEGDASNNQDLLKIIKDLPIKKDGVFNSGKYEKAKDSLIYWCNQNGYFRANFTKTQVIINEAQYGCEIIIHLNTQKQFFFGEINFKSETLDKDFIKKYIQFEHLKPFSSDQIINSQNALVQSNYFSIANIEPRYENITHKVIPIDVFLKLEKQIQLIGGAGYGSDTGFEIYGNLNFRYINRHGHKLRTKTEISERTLALEEAYVIPGKYPIEDEYQLIANYKSINIEAGISKNYKVGFFSTTKWFGWTSHLSLSYLVESYRIKDQLNTQSSKMLMPQLTLFNRYADDNLFPEKAVAFTFNFSGSKKGYLSTTTFFKTSAQADTIFNFHIFRIINRNEVGTLVINNVDDLPLSEQFFEGGPKSIRGYPYKSIGPGKYMFRSSLDIQIPITKNWYIAPFFDIGNVYFSDNENIKTSVGINIMRKTPIGPVSLGIAKAFQKNAPKFKIIFSLGPEV